MPANNSLRVRPSRVLKVCNGTLVVLRYAGNKQSGQNTDFEPVCVLNNVDKKISWARFSTAVRLAGECVI